MKKRILALLLAGLITASLASCVTSENKRPNPDTGDGTEDQQTRVEETTEPPVTIVWVDADDSVYVTADNVSLTPVENGGEKVQAKLMDQLKRVKISSDDKRSIVEKDGVQYYASNTYLSTDDLLGKSFTSCDNVKMYALNTVKIRPYASIDDSFSAAIHTLQKGDEVTVLAEGKANSESTITWRKVKFVDSENNKTYEGFVSATYLSEDPNEEVGNYSKYFTACEEENWYVSGAEKLNLRSEPDAEIGTSVRVIYKGDSVTVIAKGTETYSNWFYVKVANEKVEGLPQTYSKLYVNKNYLSQQKVELSLDELLEEYPTFEKETKTMYATSGLNVRKTPSITDEDNIQYPGLSKQDQITVLATGTVDGKQWSIFEYSTGVYRFVRTSYLTPNADGTPVVTLDSLLEENPEFSAVTVVTVYANQKAVGITSFDAASENKKEFALGAQVTKLAKGTKDGAEWYIVKDSEGGYYFVGAEFFDENQMQG